MERLHWEVQYCLERLGPLSLKRWRKVFKAGSDLQDFDMIPTVTNSSMFIE